MDQERTGAILLTRHSGDDDGFAKAARYWANEPHTREGITFTTKLKDIVTDAALRNYPTRVADYFAQYASAQLLDLLCARCGVDLAPVDVHGRQHARELWRIQQHPHLGKAVQCDECDFTTESWINQQGITEAPEVFTLEQLLSVLALRDADVLAPNMPGERIMNILEDPNNTIFISVIVPLEATRAVAITASGEGFYPTRLNWQFAGEGTPADRFAASIETINDQVFRGIECYSLDEVRDAALRALQAEVVAYLEFGLRDRKLGALDPAQRQRVEEAVSAHWAELNLGNFYNAGWSALRGVSDRKAQTSTMGRASLAGYAVNEFVRGAELMHTGAWEKREYQQPTRLAHQPRSLPLFRSILGMDLMSTTQSAIEALPSFSAPEAEKPLDDVVHEVFVNLLRSRIEDASEIKARLLTNFLRTYEVNHGLTGIKQDACYDAAVAGTEMLRTFVPDATLSGIQEELLAMREAAKDAIATPSSVSRSGLA